MALELHVWGPAFGLPSIDAECLAVISYFALAVPKTLPNSSKEQWVIIPDAETTTVPTNELPALRTSSGYWVSGFRSIVHYLQQYSNGQWDLDSHIDDQERADCLAYSSFIKAKTANLIDLSLYVSSKNYDMTTHPALFKLFNWWPNTWVIPRRMRDDAKRRTAHLGLASLDLHDPLVNQRKDSREAIVESQIPQSLKKPSNDSVSDILARGTAVSSARIQLESMVSELVKPLHHLLTSQESKTYLIGEGRHPTSLDCLALGYFSLVLVPNLPSPWLLESMTNQSYQLTAYIKSLQSICFGEQPYTIEALSSKDGGQQSDYKLPIRLATPPSLRTVTNTIIDSLLDNVAFIPTTWRPRKSTQLPCQSHRPSSSASSDESENREYTEAMVYARRREKFMTWGTFMLGGAAFVSYLVSAGIVSLSIGNQGQYDDSAAEGNDEKEQEEGVFDLGEAGQLLGL